VVRFYNKRGTAEQVDQGRQAGVEDYAAQLPSISVERSAALAQCDCLQPGQPVAMAGATAQEDRPLFLMEQPPGIERIGSRFSGLNWQNT
jgi:hypothetical protein